MITVGVFVSNIFRQNLLQILERELISEALITSQVLSDQSSLGIENTAMDNLFLIGITDKEKIISIIDETGTVIQDSQYNIEEYKNQYSSSEIIEAIRSGEGSHIRSGLERGSQYLYVAVPVLKNNQIIGFVRIASTLAYIDSLVGQLHLSLTRIGIVVVFLSLILALLIARRTTSPLHQLTTASECLKQGDLEAAKLILDNIETSTDEMSVLTRAFREMTNQISLHIKALETEDIKMAAVLDVIDDGILIVDARGLIQLTNDAALRLFKINVSQTTGVSLIQLLRNHQVVELWKQCKDSGKIETTEIELVPPQTYINCIASPLGKNLPGNTLLLFQDFTQIRKLETIRQDFISNISHELRTPLASLKALTETLQEEALEDPPAAKHFLLLMETEVDALSLMVSELLELSRIESGKVPLRMSDISPIDVLIQSVDRLHLQAERANLKIVTIIPNHLPQILADLNRLEQVVVNLLHNAIKYTPAGGEIIVSAEERNQYVLFSVQDTGTGIPSEDLPRIFERFYKIDRARSEGGTGLGLAISKHIVETHGGRIWAESLEGLGSTFYFTIPNSKISTAK
jgi:two-component system phosphate regulon sensor histidine kinase PhoR